MQQHQRVTRTRRAVALEQLSFDFAWRRIGRGVRQQQDPVGLAHTSLGPRRERGIRFVEHVPPFFFLGGEPFEEPAAAAITIVHLRRTGAAEGVVHDAAREVARGAERGQRRSDARTDRGQRHLRRGGHDGHRHDRGFVAARARHVTQP